MTCDTFFKENGYVLPANKAIVLSINGPLVKFAVSSKRRSRSVAQPKCHIEICRTMCPYRHGGWNVDKMVSDSRKNEIIVLLREMKPGVHSGCSVAYSSKRFEQGVPEGCSEISEDEVMRLARRKVLRVMDDCPLRMEHEIYGWNKSRSKKK